MNGTKFHNERVTVDGIWFDSKREARRYRELVLLAKAGAIRDLELHPKFPLNVVALWRREERAIVQVGVYTADFRYFDVEKCEPVVEDVKSAPTKTTAYRLRKRLVEAIHGITICEV